MKNYIYKILYAMGPSPKVWQKYKKYRENKLGSKLKEISFRSKENEGWNKYHINMKFENDKNYDLIHNDDIYMKAFLASYYCVNLELIINSKRKIVYQI